MLQIFSNRTNSKQEKIRIPYRPATGLPLWDPLGISVARCDQIKLDFQAIASALWFWLMILNPSEGTRNLKKKK